MSVIMMAAIAAVWGATLFAVRSKRLDAYSLWAIVCFNALWVVAPGLAAITLEHLSPTHAGLLTDSYVQLYSLEAFLIALAIVVTVAVVKLGSVTCLDAPEAPFGPAPVIVLSLWALTVAATQSTDYSLNNDLLQRQDDKWTGSVLLGYQFLTAYCTYIAISSSNKTLALAATAAVCIVAAQTLATGSRIAFVWPMFIVAYRFIPLSGMSSFSKIKTIFLASISLGGMFILFMVYSAAMSAIREQSSVAQGIGPLEMPSAMQMSEEIHTKFSSIDAGLYLIEGYEAGSAGWQPYIGSLLFFVPRFVYQSKPIAGSIDDSYAGTPARLVPALLDPDNTVLNVGVSPLAIGVWHFGWVLGPLAFLLSITANLLLLRMLFAAPSAIARSFGLYLLPLPGFQNVFPSPDVTVKHWSLALLFLCVYAVAFRVRRSNLRAIDNLQMRADNVSQRDLGG